MKKLLTLLVVLFLAGTLYADEDSAFIKSLQISQFSLSLADIATTVVRVDMEANPLVRWYIDKPPLTVAVNVSANIVITWGTSWLYKYNKTLGTVAIVAVVLFRVCIAYHNFREIGRKTW